MSTSLDDFDFDLPESSIAQQPPAERDGGRLMVLGGGGREHRRILDLPDLLAPGDLLVFNDTRVLPARLDAVKETGGRAELLLIEPAGEPRVWSAWIKTSKKPGPGSRMTLTDGSAATILARDGRRWTIRFDAEPAEVMERAGRMPLPPYIRRSAEDAPAVAEQDRERYQTRFARNPGAIAAPTASLHFSDALLAALEARADAASAP